MGHQTVIASTLQQNILETAHSQHQEGITKMKPFAQRKGLVTQNHPTD